MQLTLRALNLSLLHILQTCFSLLLLLPFLMLVEHWRKLRRLMLQGRRAGRLHLLLRHVLLLLLLCCCWWCRH